MNTDINYLLQRAMDLQLGGQEAQALEVYRQIVSIQPAADEAWFNMGMLLNKRHDDDAACSAFESFLRIARPQMGVWVEFASSYLRDRGREPPASPHPTKPDADDDSDSVSYMVDNGETRSMISLRNDSGVTPAALQTVMERFTDASTWVDAFMVLREHGELLSELSLTLFRLQGQQRETQRGINAQTNLRVLERVKQIGANAAFAEAERMTPVDFERLVRAVDHFQPVLGPLLQQLMESDADERQRLLTLHQNLLNDAETDLLLWSLWQHNGTEGRKSLTWLRSLIENFRSGIDRIALPRSVTAYRRSVNAFGEEVEVPVSLDALVQQGEQLVAELAGARPVIRAIAEHDLALMLSQRYRMTDAYADFSRAVHLLRTGLRALQPGSHLCVPHLVNLAALLVGDFEHNNRPEQLNEAGALLEEARRIEGDFSLSSPTIHSMLGSVLWRRSEREQEPGLLDDSIAMLERAVEAREPDSRERMRAQLNLANPLLARGYAGDQAAVQRVLRMAAEMRAGLQPADELIPAVLLLLGRANRIAYEWSPEADPRALERAIEVYDSMLELPFA